MAYTVGDLIECLEDEPRDREVYFIDPEQMPNMRPLAWVGDRAYWHEDGPLVVCLFSEPQE
jgi:hypothetical protein